MTPLSARDAHGFGRFRMVGRPARWKVGSAAVSVDEAVGAPVDAVCEELLQSLRVQLGADLLGSAVQGRELVIRIPAAQWKPTIEFAKKRLGLTMFCFVSGLDWFESTLQATRYENVWGSVEGDGDAPEDAGSAAAIGLQTGLAGGDSRFQVFCRLTSVTGHRGLTIKADLDEADPRVASIVTVFAGANWHERETWEMYGFWFEGHPGLRHIYLPTGFEGYPLRKDFPLLAREVKPWPGLTNVEPIAGEADEEAEG
jgi:NADH-quinone oxidoreductase subunit C